MVAHGTSRRARGGRAATQPWVTRPLHPIAAAAATDFASLPLGSSTLGSNTPTSASQNGILRFEVIP